MAEYIKRELAIKALSRGEGCGNICRRAIESIPAASVEPVVRCYQCRSYNKPRLGWCSVHLEREGPDDFCGYGARMDGGSENG